MVIVEGQVMVAINHSHLNMCPICVLALTKCCTVIDSIIFYDLKDVKMEVIVFSCLNMTSAQSSV